MRTAHGEVATPVFMPVGTGGSVRGVPHRDLDEAGASILLANTYHLYLRPGCELVGSAGGLHRFVSWNKPMLTDSGGFQVWSMRDIRRLSGEGVEFKSHIDGSRIFFTPEVVMEAQRDLGADLIMAFDECTPHPATPKQAEASWELTLNWTRRALEWLDGHAPRHGYPQYFFPIVQGGMHPDLRRRSVEELAALDQPGYAIGGLSVGEPIPQMYALAGLCAGLLPAGKPRYLMGVGTPRDLLNAIGGGVDMFDCVIPTRNARNGMVWTWDGVLHYKAARYARALDRPLDVHCRCYTCRNFSLAYLRHLFRAGELTVFHLASLHNLAFFLDLMRTARDRILSGDFETWSEGLLKRWDENERNNRREIRPENT